MPDVLPAPAATTAPASISGPGRQRIDDALGDVLAPSTRRAYERHWQAFESYCQVSGYQSLPADVDVVCEYLHIMERSRPAGSDRPYKVSYIDQVAAAIKYKHRAAVAMPIAVVDQPLTPALWEHPKISDFMRAMRNRASRAGTAAPVQEQPLLLDELTACISTARADADTWRKHLHERRDTAVLLLGWVGAQRRSEITGLRVRDVTRTSSKWTMTVRRSKTDQAGKEHVKALPTGESLITCGPCAYLRWMEAVTTYDEHGRMGLIRLLARSEPPSHHICRNNAPLPKPGSPVFRRITRAGDIDERVMSDEMVSTIVRRRLAATDLGVDAADFGAHSLRAGFVTEAYLNGKEDRQIMRQSGHRSTSGLRRYARERSAYDNNAATGLGL